MGKFGKNLKFIGNVNRILEMHRDGVGTHGIVGTFFDHGIHVTAKQVEVITDAYEPLSAKALPKSASKAAAKGAGHFVTA